MLKTDAAILPRIVAIGDIDEDEIAFAEAATGACDARSLCRRRSPGSSAGCCSRSLVLKWAARLKPTAPATQPLVAGNAGRRRWRSPTISPA